MPSPAIRTAFSIEEWVSARDVDGGPLRFDAVADRRARAGAVQGGEQGDEVGAGAGVLDDAAAGAGGPEGRRQAEQVGEPVHDVLLELGRRRAGHPRHALDAFFHFVQFRCLLVGQLVLVEAPFARGAVHDLQLRRLAGHGPQQPVAPRRGLLHVAGEHQRVERERGVAQPAVAVVPVAHTADLLGQRRRGAATIPPVGA